MNKENFANRVDELWNQLLIHMGGKFQTSNNTKEHFGIRKSDFPSETDKDSVVGFISRKIDLDKKKSGDFLKIYHNTKGQIHWNESLGKLIDYYYEIFEAAADDEKGFYKADAGNNFEKNKNAEWVKPFFNSDGQNYSTIRDSDTTLSTLSDNKNLQFTIDKVRLDYYLRLIMPEYKRNVEIEDLNRNFWVIGQALTALYAYIFDENNPLPQLLSGLLDEIVQLWENMFYLWVATSMLSEKKREQETRLIIYPITVDQINNFSESLSEKQLLEKIWAAVGNKIIDKYNDVSIIVMPQIKANNYSKNYYSKSIYPGIIIYDNTQFNHNYWLSILPFERAFIIDLKDKEIKLEKLGDDEG